jgi:hypothetical protein
MSPHLDELERLVPPPAEALPPPDWSAIEVPEDYKALVTRYGAGYFGGLTVLVPGHENKYLDMLRQIEPQRWALTYLTEHSGVEHPYPPEKLLPWGIDDNGNVVWWLMEGDWPVVANEARGDEWYRYDGGAVEFLTALLSGRVSGDFLSIE